MAYTPTCKLSHSLKSIVTKPLVKKIGVYGSLDRSNLIVSQAPHFTAVQKTPTTPIVKNTILYLYKPWISTSYLLGRYKGKAYLLKAYRELFKELSRQRHQIHLTDIFKALQSLTMLIYVIKNQQFYYQT